MSEDCI